MTFLKIHLGARFLKACKKKVRKILKRRVSVIEMTTTSNRAPLLDTLARAHSFQSVQHQHPSSIWSTAFEQVSTAGHLEDASSHDQGIPSNTADNANTPNDPHVESSLSERPGAPTPYSLPTFDNNSNETVTIRLGRTSKDTSLLTPSPIERLHDAFVVSHPAIVDNPPPFTRHSEPVRRDGTNYHDRQTAVKTPPYDEYLAMRGESERLADQLEATTQELAETHNKLDKAREELEVRQESCTELCRRLRVQDDSRSSLQRRLSTTIRRLNDLKQEHEACCEQNRRQSLKIKFLSRNRFKTANQLRDRVFYLEQELQRWKADADCSMDDALIAEEDRIEAVEILRAIEDQRDGALRQLDLQQQQIEDLERGQQQNADEDLRLAQNEAYNLHQQLRQTQAELKETRRILEERTQGLVVIEQWNQDQDWEIDSLKHRLADRKHVRMTT